MSAASSETMPVRNFASSPIAAALAACVGMQRIQAIDAQGLGAVGQSLSLPAFCVARGRATRRCGQPLSRGVSLRNVATSAGAAETQFRTACAVVSSSRMRSPRAVSCTCTSRRSCVAAGARDQALLHQAVDQLDRAVMLDLQALGKIGDARLFLIRLAFDGQHELMMLRLDAGFGALLLR